MNLSCFQNYYCYLILAVASQCYAAPFEIKVHDELIADYGQSAYEIETNLYQAPASSKLPSNIFQTRLEYGYGITKNSEIGVNIYLSNYDGTNYVNGGKISHMYIPTHDEAGIWHYGIKNEINYIRDIDGTQTTFYELTPIIAAQLKDWRITINPSVDATLERNSAVTFSPSAKIAYDVKHTLAIGVEYYSDNLPMRNVSALSPQPNTAYLVIDVKHGKSSFNIGLGKGLNSDADNWVMKFIASLNFD